MTFSAHPTAPSAAYCWKLTLRSEGTLLAADRMTAAEQMFFLGAPLAHVTEYEKGLRTRRISGPPRNAGHLTRIAIRRDVAHIERVLELAAD